MEGVGQSRIVAPASYSCFILRVALPYKIATLLYAFNEQGEVLLLERAQDPNRGLWSPCGGKLHTDTGESPYACACREAGEEMGLFLQPADLHLTGLVSEQGYEGQAHWLMFLFEIKRRLKETPAPHREGRFSFFAPADLGALRIPRTDREQLWPWFWKHRGGFFSAHCHCRAGGSNVWIIEETCAVIRVRSLLRWELKFDADTDSTGDRSNL